MTLTYFLHFVRTRLESGLSQSDVARALAVTPAVVGHWLTGRRTPSGSVMRLAEYVERYGAIEFRRNVDASTRLE